MKRTSDFLPHSVQREDRADGTILLRSTYEIGPVARRIGDWLDHWAETTPENVFIAERSGDGWRSQSYGSTLQKVRNIAQSLLARGMGAETPILIMSGNGVDHGLLTLAAHYVGIPTVPVAEQYSLIPAALGRLEHAVKLVQPAMAFVDDAARYAAALKVDALADVEIVACQGQSDGITSFDDLLRGDGGIDLVAAQATVTPDTIAKILMTSGSTSEPKGVLTSHKMICANQTQIADALPFLRQRPPRVVDWLPWNHVFGGSHNFNMMLANGGSLYVDDGKPAPGLFDRTVENLGKVAGTLCFNVPVGFQMLLDALRRDPGFCRQFFEHLDLIFYAGASLPQDVWEGIETLALEVKGEVPLMTSSWGLTETAPAVLIQQEPTDRSGVVGVPMTDVVVKLIPDDDMRCEVRVKGPNIMPGYFNAPEKTAQAFDNEGYFVTGDAMRFVDPQDMNKGLKFDGRISEDFKLLTGTRVRASQLRLDMLAGLGGLAADLVITGADRNEIGLMIFPNMTEIERRGFSTAQSNGVLTDPALLAEVNTCLATHAKGSSSSTCVSRAIILGEPASMALGEMTAKGNLNFRKILTRRADLLMRLYDNADPAVTTL
ncbi:feruloyl-CoA synthase [Sulfitobacter sp. F26204]|uniref:feruloyl-CoA synthase n=1 Tax=Sulfitobacter sp. F26204 TaxID=2996014 RepID=UPI00225DFFDF|nr:feruloyl-CoA synthase [Sulfitobacter sp. F26204]MCX7560164.1 feruloyl-CoA synthase [Sulfitobacter sp. F26204]